MLKSKKNVFWEALIITVFIFLMGLFLGMLIETSNSEKVSNLYMKSEINLVDGLATALLTEEFKDDCATLHKNNVEFADRVYQEALMLEEFESFGSLTGGLELLHKKYDLLRTLLWMSNQDSLRRCDNFKMVVYLYESESEDLEKSALQNVWSRILLDVKKENPEIILLPIAADKNITTLKLLVNEYQISQLPAVVVDNDKVIYRIDNVSSFQDSYVR